MTLTTRRHRVKVDMLPKDFGSLAGGLPPAEPGTLFVMGINGGMRVSPEAEFDVVFGRCEPDVHVCVGEDDPHVSRRQGYITRQGSRWVLHNTGRLAIRFPGSRLVLGGHRAELPVAHTPLFIVGPELEHFLDVRVAAKPPSPRRGDLHEVETYNPDGWQLSPTERLVLVCLAERYLRQEPWPQPLTWAQVVEALRRLRPNERWSDKRAARIVAGVREQLSKSRTRPVAGLQEEEIPSPLGNAINHNLITELLVTATITTSDLHLLDG